MGKSRKKPPLALLVNPWIYDFAAYNFWIRPLGLYKVAEWLWERGIEVKLVDCLSPFEAPGKFRREKVETPKILKGILPRQYSRYGITEEEFLERLKGAGNPDFIFVTSGMSYWYPGVRRAIELLKKRFPSSPVILGGVYATLWEEHAIETSGADMVVSGPIEKNVDALNTFLSIPKRPIRQRLPWYRLGLHDGIKYSAIRTALGCPFKCTYCGSFKISGGYKEIQVDATIDELIFLHSKGVRQIAFYDDALLVNFPSRLKKILDYLNKINLHFQFHTPNGLHARFITKEVAMYFKNSNFNHIRVSLETSSPERQEATGGKVTNEAFERAVKYLLECGLNKEYIGIYLLVGLPGQSLKEVEDSIRFVRSLGIRPYLAEFSPIPGTIEWKRLEETRRIDYSLDPLLTNNTIFSRLFSGIGEDEWKRLKEMCRQG